MKTPGRDFLARGIKNGALKLRSNIQATYKTCGVCGNTLAIAKFFSFLLYHEKF